MIGLGMTYDGRIAFVTNYGTVGVIDRLFRDPHYLSLGEKEYVFNSIACDEEGGIYVVTQNRLVRVQWTGTELTLDPGSGAWSAEYETGWTSTDKWAEGTGATPTLMGAGDQDKFVVITDGQAVMNIVLFWRAEIPADWVRIPGSRDRRIAAQAPITFGLEEPERSWTENSVVVRGYGALVVNNLLQRYERANPAQKVILAGEPGYAPYGVEKFEWDPRARKLRSAWANREISLPSSTPAMSAATNLVYAAGQRNAVWTLEAIDWDSGRSVFHHRIGDRVRHNSGMSTVAIGPGASIYYGTFWGLIRIRP